MMSFEELQKAGLVSKTQQYSGNIGWGYKILRWDQVFSSSIYSKEEIVKNQQELFSWYFVTSC